MGKHWNKKTKTGSYRDSTFEVVTPSPHEVIPDELDGLVTSVVVVTAATRTPQLDQWLRSLVDSQTGAIVVDGAVEYVNPTRRIVYRLGVLGDDYEGIAAWVRARDALYQPLLQHLRPRVHELAAAPTMAAAPLFAVWPWPQDVRQAILALAEHADAPAALLAQATQIHDHDAAMAESSIAKPATIGELRAIYESSDANRLRRLRGRIDRDWFWSGPRLLFLELAESGWAPRSDELLEMIVEDTAIGRWLDDAVLARVMTEEFAAKGALARAIHDRAANREPAYKEWVGKLTQERVAIYEKYRDDPLVVKPRPRGMEPALYRSLIDALYGEARQHPMLPEVIVMLVCDRRYDVAEAAFVETFGGTAEQAAVAIRDAANYFTPGAAR
ncbi:MAG: hypothetical protein QM831_46320 [Kofleriaceae bacterium]